MPKILRKPPPPCQKKLEIARAIQDELTARGWTIDQLAKSSQIAPHILNAILSGNRRIGWAIARKLAQAFNQPVSSWIGGNHGA